jgi:hypothetical protein
MAFVWLKSIFYLAFNHILPSCSFGAFYPAIIWLLPSFNLALIRFLWGVHPAFTMLLSGFGKALRRGFYLVLSGFLSSFYGLLSSFESG